MTAPLAQLGDVTCAFTAEVTEVMVNGPDDVYVER
jgi:hypothetical protein